MAMLVHPSCSQILLVSLLQPLLISPKQLKSFEQSRISRICSLKPRSRRFLVLAAEKETHFEVDREKAREALKKLDEQILRYSQKEISKIRDISYLESDQKRDMIAAGLGTEDMPQYSGSYLAYSAVALLILTVFYNIVFIAIIKPSVDGKDPTSTTVTQPMNRVPLKQAPTVKDQS